MNPRADPAMLNDISSQRSAHLVTVAGAVGLLIPLLSSLAALRLAAVLVGAAMTNQFLLEESPWLPLAVLVVAAVIAWARRSSNSILLDILRR